MYTIKVPNLCVAETVIFVCKKFGDNYSKARSAKLLL